MMLLIRSTQDFSIQGIPYPGIPILVNDEMKVVESVLKFIIYHCVENGRVKSHRTIVNYANALYDFFSFLQANKLSWKQSYKESNKQKVSVLALYRNWPACLAGSAALKASTINTRLAAIQQFYIYCHQNKLIEQLPWNCVVKVKRSGDDDFLRHTRSLQHIDTTGLKLKSYKQPPKILSVKQAKELIQVVSNPTLSLMLKMALTTGMRREELLTFQRNKVFKPSESQMNKRLAVDLIPATSRQKTKGDRPRTIYLPGPLMMDLYEYISFGEGVQRHKKVIFDSHKQYLFLNKDGQPFSDNALNTLLNKVYQSGQISFSVTPHMLRHTFATIELYAESSTKDMAQALAWVRDRLGHSSIQTTMVYIHCIEQLAEHELHQYQNELLMMASA